LFISALVGPICWLAWLLDYSTSKYRFNQGDHLGWKATLGPGNVGT
jgi:hypothetical protein